MIKLLVVLCLSATAYAADSENSIYDLPGNLRPGASFTCFKNGQDGIYQTTCQAVSCKTPSGADGWQPTISRGEVIASCQPLTGTPIKYASCFFGKKFDDGAWTFGYNDPDCSKAKKFIAYCVNGVIVGIGGSLPTCTNQSSAPESSKSGVVQSRSLPAGK